MKADEWRILVGLCIFIAFISFKPSEPYLSQYLVCNELTQAEECAAYTVQTDCNAEVACGWNAGSSSCLAVACEDVNLSDCGDEDFAYCEKSGAQCKSDHCYKNFTEDEVNNEIYPFSTYAYLVFLVFLGPFAEIYSYRIAIIIGLMGRIGTRFLLLFGRSVGAMQAMQVTYAMGTAVQDIFSAYIFYVLSPASFQDATSYLRATGFAAHMISGIFADLLVIEGGVSLSVLFVISAVSVCIGELSSLYVFRFAVQQFEA
jgi:hypothetical protein